MWDQIVGNGSALFRCPRAGGDCSYYDIEQFVDTWVELDGQPAPEWGSMGLYEVSELCQVSQAGRAVRVFEQPLWPCEVLLHRLLIASTAFDSTCLSVSPMQGTDYFEVTDPDRETEEYDTDSEGVSCTRCDPSPLRHGGLHLVSMSMRCGHMGGQCCGADPGIQLHSVNARLQVVRSHSAGGLAQEPALRYALRGRPEAGCSGPAACCQ